MQVDWDSTFDDIIFGGSGVFSDQLKYDRSLYRTVKFLLEHLPHPPPPPEPVPAPLAKVARLPALLAHPVTKDIFAAFLVDGDEEALLENVAMLGNLDGELVSARPAAVAVHAVAETATRPGAHSNDASRNLPPWGNHEVESVQLLEFWAGMRKNPPVVV